MRAIKLLFIGAALITLSGCGEMSGNAATVGSVLINLSSTFPAIWKLCTALAYVLGISFGLRGIYYLKIYGEARSMMPTQGSMTVPVVYLVVSSVLMFVPTAFQIMSTTVFGTTNPLAIQTQQSTSDATLQAILYFVQVIGLISFIRGWVQLANSTKQGQHGALSKGATHIFGGVIAMNIGSAISIMQNTFGLGG